MELPKFLKGEEELSNETDIMIYLIKNMGELKTRTKKLADKNLDKLFEVSMFANMESPINNQDLTVNSQTFRS